MTEAEKGCVGFQNDHKEDGQYWEEEGILFITKTRIYEG